MHRSSIALFKKLSNKREILDKSGKTKVEVIVMMLHNEARNLLVQAFEKNHNAKQVAEDFQVSVSTVYHLTEKMRKSGTVDLQTHNSGRKRILSDSELQAIRSKIEEQNDITIEELRETLKLHASYSTVERAIRAMGFRYKKLTLHASERDRLRGRKRTYKVERILTKR